MPHYVFQYISVHNSFKVERWLWETHQSFVWISPVPPAINYLRRRDRQYHVSQIGLRRTRSIETDENRATHLIRRSNQKHRGARLPPSSIKFTMGTWHGASETIREKNFGQVAWGGGSRRYDKITHQAEHVLNRELRLRLVRWDSRGLFWERYQTGLQRSGHETITKTYENNRAARRFQQHELVRVSWS